MLEESREKNFNLVRNVLIKHLNSEYILLGVPKHMNLGDSLIWQAEKEILDTINYERKHTYFWGEKNIDVNKNTIIVFSGGGSWDDIWNTISYIEYIIERYKNNKIIFLPNSVWYENKNRIQKTIEILNNHSAEIILCSREKQSYDIAVNNFKNVKNYLLPDVALTWDVFRYMKNNNIDNISGKGALFISRNDKEKKKKLINEKFDKISDWGTMEVRPEYTKSYKSCSDWENNILPKLIKESIEFILPYNIIYSDRMHGAILSLLLDKETYLLDNSYGKSKNLYNTWLENENKINYI